MIRFGAIVILSASLSWLILGYSMLQARQIAYVKQDVCIVPGSNVHLVYRVMLSNLRQEVQDWTEFKGWSDDEMPSIAPSIEAYRLESQANLKILEQASICVGQS